MRTTSFEKPLSSGAGTRALFVAGAAALGALLGGVVFKRTGRLAFAALAAFVARDVWLGEGRTGLENLLRAPYARPPRS